MGKHPFNHSCAITNTVVSYPFFMMGHLLRKWKDVINNYKVTKTTYIGAMLSLLVVIVGGWRGKYILLSCCNYGESYLLFIFGGLAGSLFVFYIAKVLDKYYFESVYDLSVGTIIILGFHIHLIAMYREYVFSPTLWDSIFSISILILFIPIIRLSTKHFPLIIGKYRTKNNINKLP